MTCCSFCKVHYLRIDYHPLLGKFIHSDPETNAGIVISPRIDNNNFKNTNILVTLYHSDTDENSPTFACDCKHFINYYYHVLNCYGKKNGSVKITMYFILVSLVACSTVEDVIMHGIREFNLISNPNDYMLKVRGLSEYFLPHTRLSCYLYVHQCIKLDENVELCLLPISQISRNLARTVSVIDMRNYIRKYSNESRVNLLIHLLILGSR